MNVSGRTSAIDETERPLAVLQLREEPVSETGFFQWFALVRLVVGLDINEGDVHVPATVATG